MKQTLISSAVVLSLSLFPSGYAQAADDLPKFCDWCKESGDGKAAKASVRSLGFCPPEEILYAKDHPCPPEFCGQCVDPDFHPNVRNPAYPIGQGPLVVIDAAHNNFHKADTNTDRFWPFAELLRRDGYNVRSSNGIYTRISARALREHDVKILVIANAVNEVNVRTDCNRCLPEWRLPTPSAFTETEIRELKDWVLGSSGGKGGSLMLLADHFPFAGAAQNLAESLGFRLSNGYTGNPESSLFPLIEFTNLPFHPIFVGRSVNPLENIESVTSFMGSAFVVRPEFPITSSHEYLPLMIFSSGTKTLLPRASCQVESPDGPDHVQQESAEGMLQGSTASSDAYRRAKIAIFGEAGMFTAQVALIGCDPQDPTSLFPCDTPCHNKTCQQKSGMNSRQAPNNQQFALNVVHWLDGLLD